MDLAMEAGSRLLWEVIVPVDQRRVEQDPLDSLVNVESLVWM